MSEGKSINKVDVFGNAINVAFNLVWPVGVTYPQYPGEKSPMDLWGEFSTWKPINYNGAFFRAAGGNANPWIEVTTTNGRNFTIKEGRTVPLNSALKYGATVMFNGESRTVNSVVGSGANITSFDVNSAFTEPDGGYKNITNVYILQSQGTAKNGLSVSDNISFTDSGHKHLTYFISSSTVGFGNIGGGAPFPIPSGVDTSEGYAQLVKTGGVSMSDGDVETRPTNIAYTIWRRTA